MLSSSYDRFTFVTDDHVFADCITNGTVEPYPCDLRIVRKYLSVFPNRCRTYVDIGAHIGTTIAPYSRLFKTIVGFEANSSSFELLERNMKTNNIECRLEPIGLYSHSCKGHIRQHGGGNSGCYYFQEDPSGPIECKTLDDYKLEDVDFLKIDTEGSELFILKGAKETISRCKPFIQVECNSLSDSLYGIPIPVLVDYLTSIGYCLYEKGQANWFFYYPHIEPYRIFCFWTGNTPMSENRRKCLEEMKTTECDITFVTPENLDSFILQNQPIHPAYQYLSEVHKSDYLRTYFMRHYGGGYADIKLQGGSWKPAFDVLLQSTAYINGYPEAKAGDIAYEPVSHAWNELVGNGGYICKPNTPFTREWYASMNLLLDEKLEALRMNPATHARDRTENGSNYPLGWNELLGRIFHRISYEYRKHILRSLPCPSFYNYL